MKIEKIVQAGIGLYLMLPGLEDAASSGITLGPSVAVGGLLLANAFGVKI